jgi:prepilin-type N-terminal cleavage/methylation domain-containing protein
MPLQQGGEVVFIGSNPPPTDKMDKKTNRKKAFTLVELLIVVSVIAVLLGLSLPVLGKMIEGGQKAAEISAAKNLISGFLSYSADNNNSILPGNRDPGSGTVKDGQGNFINEELARSRYAWRLAPYIGYDVDKTLLVNNTKAAPKDSPKYNYLVSVYTSLGMNTTFIGGDWSESALIRAEDRRASANGKFYIDNLAQAANPSQMIVFASAFSKERGEVQGNHRIFPQSLRGGESSQIGYRYDGKAIVACLDGHVEMLDESQMKDMRRWSNRAARENNPNQTRP